MSSFPTEDSYVSHSPEPLLSFLNRETKRQGSHHATCWPGQDPELPHGVPGLGYSGPHHERWAGPSDTGGAVGIRPRHSHKTHFRASGWGVGEGWQTLCKTPETLHMDACQMEGLPPGQFQVQKLQTNQEETLSHN